MELPEITPQAISAIDVPILLIIGDSDIVAPEHAVAMFRLLGGGVLGDLAAMPSTRLAVLPGHIAHRGHRPRRHANDDGPTLPGRTVSPLLPTRSESFRFARSAPTAAVLQARSRGSQTWTGQEAL